MNNSEWKTYKLGEILTLKRGYDLPKQDRVEGAIPIYSSAGLSGYHSEAKIKGPGVITGRYGTLGEVFYSKTDYWPHNTTLYVKDFKGNHPKFIFYFLQTLGFAGNNDKTSVPGLNRNDLHEMRVSIPNLPNQHRIASILSSLDDKIELNRQTNATLEAMAQALFQEWFVDFNFPGATGEMVESELGMVPVGWEVGTVGDLFELQRGFDLPAGSRINGDFPIYAASGLNGYHQEYRIKAPGITTGRSGVLGNVFYVQEDFWPLNTSLFVKRFNRATPLFAYYVLQGIDLNGLNGGSAVPTLNRNEVHKLRTILPEPQNIEQYEKAVKPIFRLIHSKQKENNVLVQLRDSLLPRLMKEEI